ncbi:DNA repair protein RadA [Luteibaculum oceani]|uniref:DNA repair protein RadA n=1 Tax=Luteibaculum oceani TaxID=1294296 RepID=A0A5C6V195_9FLAO|nr:DNA repair protein RadA [Luteibaculum oceani]TXC78979.1 DNA repair protein RadA [Luteibaculum oceani]
MAKLKKAFFCSNCGYEASKWQGKCPACNQWNTFTEEIISKQKSSSTSFVAKAESHPNKLVEVNSEEKPRIILKDAELNRLMGGGIMPGSVVLLGGEPGIGKSTLLLQLLLQFHQEVLYVSGEESSLQIKDRASRISSTIPNTFYISAETDIGQIVKYANELKPKLLVIDSIQTLQHELIDSVPGSISQIRACCGELIKLAKTTDIPIFVIGHITKDGQIAGPKLLEHMVDVVLQFEGDHQYFLRLLRGVKNRFGNTNEIALYEMQQGGLNPVANPGEVFISGKDENLSGTATGIILEGVRPLLIESQALVSSAVYGTPQRSATGFDVKRLNMLLAVLEKRCGFKLGAKDVFLNIAGGFKINDTGSDLAVVMAILSSAADISIPAKTAFAAEIGLTGEVRPVTRLNQRISEAAKLGYKQLFVSKYAKNIDGDLPQSIEVVPISQINEAVARLFA